MNSYFSYYAHIHWSRYHGLIQIRSAMSNHCVKLFVSPLLLVTFDDEMKISRHCHLDNNCGWESNFRKWILRIFFHFQTKWQWELALYWGTDSPMINEWNSDHCLGRSYSTLKVTDQSISSKIIHINSGRLSSLEM